MSNWPITHWNPKSFACLSGLVIALSALVAAGCGKPLGQFVWVDDYAAPEVPEYQLQPGDILTIKVYKEDALSGKVKVRLDGRISLPLLDDVPAAGRTTTILARDLEQRLKPLVNKPTVSVLLEETRPKQFSVVGEVSRPGTYALEPGLGVLQALANAGGLNEFANRDRVFVLRQGMAERVRFTYEALAHGEGKGSTFLLQPGDVIVVE
ncbi:MAG TPA: polysaccharide biosynthesis/export family protein [Myxococcaceae bacterium]|nr:polysaccharide biosynthesis/export family protein [Myxococcaceae bacterium]